MKIAVSIKFLRRAISGLSYRLRTVALLLRDFEFRHTQTR